VTTGRRLTVLLLALLLIGAPAVVLSVACVGKSCQTTSVAKAEVPFCPLPAELRTLLENGFYKGRSPEVFAVAKEANVHGGTGGRASGASSIWPYPDQASETTVPIVLYGDGVISGADVPDGTGVDQIAPTLANIVGLGRGHPEVRAGVAIDGIWERATPRLVVMVGIKGLGGPTVQHWPYLLSLMKQGDGTLGSTQSLPIDSAASLTTFGTGGLPSQHGITGSLIRNGTGDLTPAWGKGAPGSVIATLADDLDYERNNEPLVGMVSTDERDRGLIGDGWYTLGSDSDPFIVAQPTKVADAAAKMLGKGFGRDNQTDLLGVTLDGSRPQEADAELQALVQDANAVSGGSLTVAIAGTGSAAAPGKDAVTAKSVVLQVQDKVGAPGVVETAVPGGLFLNQQILSDRGLPAGKIVDALAGATDGKSGQPLVLDAYPAFSVSFARFCGR